MSRRPAKTLSDEDRVLWNIVARTAKPLKGTVSVGDAPVEPMTMDEALQLESRPPTASTGMPAGKPTKQVVTPALDKPTRDKLKNGRLPIEGRVDLHGMTQDEAYSLLLSFLARAHGGGVRYVLVITGKGSSSGGEGVLRRAVPGWLATAPFRSIVSSHDHAARNHGGAGAIYVRLRRRAEARS